ncbi:putative Late nodulin [Medicago truncatula]|uniref:Nodule Cysteine-Rich (NCR) secreted peptide n=1 Tax=Medicago truncatula TaxID=3880 RepID=A7KH78_MEDTR|nr:nodule-specific cysteine-rich peptide 68 [Medicago truncatula]AES75687.1 Nodule Cysteine-Rich (NCR) secreted peptide [Medicago truncatula]AFK47397.1 unknown [Medicago truncatula]RHN51622.1 putative Late nodulin [Medicago truncatula]
MAQILMFVYFLIIFLSLFLVESIKIFTEHRCRTDADCPARELPEYLKCQGGMCRLLIKKD